MPGSPDERPAGDEWNRKRERVLCRDGYRCQKCGADLAADDVDAEVHHETPISQGGSHEPENLISLCAECHHRVHGAVALEDVVDVFDEIPAPAILTGDVAERLECSRQTARRKLDELCEQGRVARRKRETHTFYWLPDGGEA